MAKTWEDLRVRVGADDGGKDEVLQDSFAQAQVLVDKYVGEAQVPEEILDLAYLAVGQDLYDRIDAPNGVQNAQFVATDGSIGGAAVRINRDPLQAAYKYLSRWVMPF